MPFISSCNNRYFSQITISFLSVKEQDVVLILIFYITMFQLFFIVLLLIYGELHSMSQERTFIGTALCQAHTARSTFAQRIQAALNEYHQSLQSNGNSLTHLNHVPTIVQDLTAQHLTQSAFSSLQPSIQNSFGFEQFRTLADIPDHLFTSISPMTGNRIAVGSSINQIFIYNAGTHRYEKTLDATFAHFNKANSLLITINYTTNSLTLYDAEFNSIAEQLYTCLPIIQQRSENIIAVSLNGFSIFFAHNNNVIEWNVAKREFLKLQNCNDTIYCLAAHPCDNHILAVGDATGTVTVYSPSPKLLTKDNDTQCIYSLCYNTDGTLLAIGARNKFLLCNTTTGKIIYLIATAAPVFSIHISPNNAYFLFASNNTVYILNNALLLTNSFITASDVILSAKFLADGSGIAVATRNGHFNIWRCSHYHTINPSLPSTDIPFDWTRLVNL